MAAEDSFAARADLCHQYSLSPVSLTLVRNNQKAKKIFAGVNDTAEKLFTGVNDTADKFFGGVSDTGDKRVLPILACLHLKMKNNQNFNLEV